MEVLLSYNRTSDTTAIILNAIYYGPNATMAGYLKPFLALGPVRSAWNQVPWNKLYTVNFFGGDPTDCTYDNYLASAGQASKATDPPTWTEFFDRYAAFSRAHPTYSGSFIAVRLGQQGPLSFPDSSSAYPYRDVKTHLVYYNRYPAGDAALEADVNRYIADSRALFQPTTGYPNLTLYIHYNHGDEGPVTWYSAAKLPRLSALKRTWDPQQLFSWYVPIPLQYP